MRCRRRSGAADHRAGWEVAARADCAGDLFADLFGVAGSARAVSGVLFSRIIHRDLKPTNIFLTADRTVKIGDFGISRSLDRTQLAATSMIGTPYYLSPEMVEGKPYSTKADIWALGVVLYQLASFKLPFEANSLPVLALKILKGSFPPLPSHYSKDFKALLLQMLQVDQKKRPSLETILLKPFIFKLLPKEEQAKLMNKQEQREQAKR